MSERIEKIRDAIQVMYCCEAEHTESCPVVEMIGDKTVWEGVVEVFNVSGINDVARCYAWMFHDGSEDRFAVVLKKPPIMSPAHAVRAFILESTKPNGVKVSKPQ